MLAFLACSVLHLSLSNFLPPLPSSDQNFPNSSFFFLSSGLSGSGGDFPASLHASSAAPLMASSALFGSPPSPQNTVGKLPAMAPARPLMGPLSTAFTTAHKPPPPPLQPPAMRSS